MPFPSPADDRLNGPPPNPVTDPAAAQESSPARTVMGGAIPPAGPAAGPDMTGVLALYQKVDEACLALAQMDPAQAGQIDTARTLIEQCAARFSTQSASNAMGLPLSPPPGVVSQAGPQFPGSQVSGRAY